MGVSGCGKSTIGALLSDSLKIPFFDGDDFHPESNKQKMKSGTPLNDVDRRPWLQAIVDHANKEVANGNSVLFACSALKQKYRTQLRTADCPVIFVHLVAPIEVIAPRQANRPGHFMPIELLKSQFETLESPADEPGVIEVSVEAFDPDAIISDITQQLEKSA